MSAFTFIFSMTEKEAAIRIADELKLSREEVARLIEEARKR